jgi:ABC-type transport system involved in cytochrome bd biosynthesis fused ATPase/permease subunit
MARITMKLFLILLVLISNTTLASFTPLSGTFSNAARGINTIRLLDFKDFKGSISRGQVDFKGAGYLIF